ncbi:acyltransferase [Altererythrobacter sp. B11]|nr:acyltransferase [Altererythrobacter sp. B11]
MVSGRFPWRFGRPAELLREEEPAAVPSGAVHSYRPDIDGLRALAVLSVVFYHAGFRGFSGGYVGVDIFFVISGYLITGIIVRDLEVSRHTIARFYRRRVLRIFPALFFVTLVTTALAAIFLLPSELERYARSLAAATLFGSNVLFYGESGYFDAASEVKPLLHTWSLAIEEQFYIIWPLALAWVGATRLRRLRLLVWTVTAASLVAAIVMVSRDREAAFYLLPSRAWELGIGGVIATLPRRPLPRWLDEVLAAAGGLAILLCVWKYNVLTTFPGLTAVPVCGGAALIILTGTHRATLVSRILSLRPAIFVGKISYSLYLWHWPVLVFAAVSLLPGSRMTINLAAVALSFVLAFLSWRFVETPFRVGGPRWSDRAVFGAALAAMAAALVTAGVLLAANGFANRYSPHERKIASYLYLDQEESYRSGSCFISDYSQTFAKDRCLQAGGGKPLVLLIGDSYSAHLWPGLSQADSPFTIAQASMVGCPPGIYPGVGGKTCERFFRSLLTQWVPEHKPAAVLLAGRWHVGDYDLVRATLADPRLADTKLILIGPPPQYESALPRLLVAAESRKDPHLPARFADPQAFPVDRKLREIAREAGVPYISLIDNLCRGKDCRVWAKDDIPLQFDNGHFSAVGSREVVDLIEKDLVGIINGDGRGTAP